MWRADGFGPAAVGVFASGVLQTIEFFGSQALPTCGCLCEDAMAKVLAMKTVTASEDALFVALLRWLCCQVSVGDVDRTVEAGRLIHHLSLQTMAPSFLLHVASKSGLASRAVLFDAFQSRALQTKAENGRSSVTRAERSLPKSRFPKESLVHSCGSSAIVSSKRLVDQITARDPEDIAAHHSTVLARLAAA